MECKLKKETSVEETIHKKTFDITDINDTINALKVEEGITKVSIIRAAFDSIIEAQGRGVTITMIADALSCTTGMEFKPQSLRNTLSLIKRERSQGKGTPGRMDSS
jgi:hypothetical protein